MLIDGKKMACEACIRGHRVSGCQHRERKLVEIAKKGRPVTQCQHCRSLRKSRSSHVKCECGALAAAKKARAQAKSEGERSKNASGDEGAAGSQHAGVASSAAATTEVGGDSKSGSASPCSCCHGGRCTCALKKEPQHHPLDAVPELSAAVMVPSSAVTDPVVRVPRPKARLQSIHSESSLTHFVNGHHKPTHRHHSSIHGASPYSIPTVGHTGHTFGEHEGSHRVHHPTDGTASAPPTAPPKHRRVRSEQSSPELHTYLAIPMSNSNNNSIITPLELTPRPPAPMRPAINRTSSGRIQTGLSVITNPTSFAPYNNFHQPYNQPDTVMLSAAPEDQYLVSANLDPSATSGWPAFSPFENNYDNFDMYGNAFTSTAFCDEVRGYSMFHSVPVPLTTASSDDHDSDYRITSPPSLVSQALSNADSEDFAAFSAHSSFIDLPRLAENASRPPSISSGPSSTPSAPSSTYDPTEHSHPDRPMSTVPEEPAQSQSNQTDPFSQGVMFGGFSVPYDESIGLKSIDEVGLMSGDQNMVEMGGMQGGMVASGMQGMGNMVAVVSGSNPPSNVDPSEEYLYMGWV